MPDEEQESDDLTYTACLIIIKQAVLLKKHSHVLKNMRMFFSLVYKLSARSDKKSSLQSFEVEV